MKATLKVGISSYWLCGSGRGEGPGADEVPIVTPEGLPFLPGKTLRGLLRAAADLLVEAGAYGEDKVRALFGSSPLGDAQDGKDEHVSAMEFGRYTTCAGQLCLTSATLGKTTGEKFAWRRWAATSANEDAVRQAFVQLGSTRIDALGVADDQTLRAVQVAVPMTLYAAVEAPDAYTPLLGDAASLVRELGSGRNRGFGRAELALDVTGGKEASDA